MLENSPNLWQKYKPVVSKILIDQTAGWINFSARKFTKFMANVRFLWCNMIFKYEKWFRFAQLFNYIGIASFLHELIWYAHLEYFFEKKPHHNLDFDANQNIKELPNWLALNMQQISIRWKIHLIPCCLGNRIHRFLAFLIFFFKNIELEENVLLLILFDVYHFSFWSNLFSNSVPRTVVGSKLGVVSWKQWNDTSKVIIYMLRGEVSLVKQPTIESVLLAY